MMDWTDRHCRFLLRLIAPGALLYTEMVTAAAVEHGDRERLLGFDTRERPVALQLGGSDPTQLASAAAIGVEAGYDQINLNVGCPSGRVQAGRFGACLMAEPELVADCVAAMRDRVAVPVTVKTRIGIDDNDNYDFLRDFVEVVATRGSCSTFVIHARIALLKGLSPKQNRAVPPLQYDRVRRLRDDFPDLRIVVNGGIRDRVEFVAGLEHFHGVMVGRAAYHNPMVLADMTAALNGGDPPPPTREQIVNAYLPYVRSQLAQGVRLHAMTRHMLGLFQGQPGARRWRRLLTEASSRNGAGVEVIERALGERHAA